MPREVLSAVGGVAAAYTVYDSRKCAPLRARLRLCASRVVEHRELHHEVVSEKTCRACCTADTYESVEHIVFVCPAFGGVRTATQEALRAVALDFDLRTIAGCPRDSAAASMAIRLTAPFLTVVRNRLCF